MTIHTCCRWWEVTWNVQLDRRSTCGLPCADFDGHCFHCYPCASAALLKILYLWTWVYILQLYFFVNIVKWLFLDCYNLLTSGHFYTWRLFQFCKNRELNKLIISLCKRVSPPSVCHYHVQGNRRSMPIIITDHRLDDLYRIILNTSTNLVRWKHSASFIESTLFLYNIIISVPDFNSMDKNNLDLWRPLTCSGGCI